MFKVETALQGATSIYLVNVQTEEEAIQAVKDDMLPEVVEACDFFAEPIDMSNTLTFIYSDD